MSCKICQVEFQQPLEQVADWDDRQRTVKWLSSSKEDSPQQHVKDKVNMLSVMWKKWRRGSCQIKIKARHTCIFLHAGDRERSWALLLCGRGLPMGVRTAYQSSLWLCEVQLQHWHHSLQRHHALPNQAPQVSQALCMCSVHCYIKPELTIHTASDTLWYKYWS